MGAPIARNLLRAVPPGDCLQPHAKRAEDLESDGAIVASSPAEASQAEAVFRWWLTITPWRASFSGSGGLLEAMPKAPSTFPSSTISVALSKRLAEAHEGAGTGYIAAPVFRTAEGSCGGGVDCRRRRRAEWIERVRPALEAIGRKLAIVGKGALAGECPPS